MKELLLTVESVIDRTETLFEMRLCSEQALPPMKCGQFLHLEVPGGDLLLRRPFCLYKYDEKSVTIIVAVVGEGTRRLQRVKPGEKLKATLPIGNGFTLEDKHKKIVLLGGGVGIAPLAPVPVTYPDREYYAFLGVPNKKMAFFLDEFEKNCRTIVCTEDGSFGKRGYPTDVFLTKLDQIRPDVILTCGPLPFLKAVARLSAEHKIPAYMSNEARMGCGVGACLVCTCAIRGADGQTENKRVCVDGPVFKLEDVVL